MHAPALSSRRLGDDERQAIVAVPEQAIRRRGIPKRLYVDNGAAFRAQHLALVCARLGITLIRARTSPKAKAEWSAGFGPYACSFCRRCSQKIRIASGHQSSALGLGGGGIPPQSASRSRRSHARGPLGDVLQRRAFPSNDPSDLFLLEQKRRVHADRTVSPVPAPGSPPPMFVPRDRAPNKTRREPRFRDSLSVPLSCAGRYPTWATGISVLIQVRVA